MNRIIVMGRLATDFDLSFLPNGGRAVGKFRIAVKRTYKETNGEYKSDFFNVQCWGQTAEYLSDKLIKGNRAFVEGALYINEYTNKDNVKIYSPVINADKVEIIDYAAAATTPAEGWAEPQGAGKDNNVLW